MGGFEELIDSELTPTIGMKMTLQPIVDGVFTEHNHDLLSLASLQEIYPGYLGGLFNGYADHALLEKEGYEQSYLKHKRRTDTEL